MSARPQPAPEIDVRERALAAARAVRQASEPWRAAGLERRLEVLARAGEALHHKRGALVDGLRSDGFSTELATFWSEWILRACEPRLLEEYARSMVRLVPSGSGAELLARRADGVVLLSPPANAPTINTAPIFSVLLAGNGVLLRAPERSRGVALIVDEALRPALVAGGFAVETATLVRGKSRDIAAALIPSPDVDTIVYFGKSTAVSDLAAMARCAGKKLMLELEGSDHLAVWRDGDVRAAVESTRTVWHLSTQPCPVPKHLIVHGAACRAFLDGLLATLPAASRTIEADRERGRLVPIARMDEFLDALDELEGAGGMVRAGGFRMDASGARDDDGPYAAPTVVEIDADTCLRRPLRCFDDEIAWPLVPVVRCDTDDDRALEQMCALMAASSHGLRASVWTRSAAVMARFTRDVGHVGLLRFNDDHARPPWFASAWGGSRKSGGPNGELCFFWEKTSRLQAIDCSRLSQAEISAVAEALGCARLIA
jgi:acyl-CoA reductase-like NAD-dependent aldehyde dehydrogenase